MKIKPEINTVTLASPVNNGYFFLRGSFIKKDADKKSDKTTNQFPNGMNPHFLIKMIV
jgi:hypothetical protein